MTPVQMRRDDDCVAACMASLLDLPVEDVPYFDPSCTSASDFWGAWRAWLRNRGLRLRFHCGSLPSEGPFLAVQPTIAPPVKHATVHDGAGLLWDPEDQVPKFSLWQVIYAVTVEPL